MVSSIGLNVSDAFAAIRSGASGIQKLKYLPTNYKDKLLVGEVKATNEQLHQLLQLSEKGTFSRTAMLGIMAAREAIKHAQIDDTKALRTGLISSTTVGGIDRSELFYQNYRKGNGEEDLRLMISHDCGDSTEKIADDIGINDFITTISTACSSSANAIMLGARMIKSGRLDRAIVGGTDALTRYTLNGFHSLKILDEEFCRPFDETRAGLNLGEGAGFIVIESEAAVNASQKEPLALLTGYGNANDAYHQTASSPEGLGALNAMQNALNVGQLDANLIDYINVHGTATVNNDLSEGTAMKSLFRDHLPRFSSTKSFTGHTLAAAGVIEAVFSVMSMQNNLLIPNLNFKQPIEQLGIVPVTTLQEGVKIEHILSNSFGFGGNCSSLVFSACS